MRRVSLSGLLLSVGVAAVVLLALAHSGEIRARASTALGKGMPAPEAELARGFVLGQDERIDAATVEDFRRSGLSHLLAVSGQNVALLALLAMPVLAAFGLPLRARLVWMLGLIAVYVSLAGAGPSIQRAAVMGGLSVMATLVGRRASRLHALVLAALATLAVQPGIASDVGWQLSFAAVLGILLLAPSLRRAIAVWVGARGWRHALVEGAAMTIAATLATAPLIAFHFGELSTTTLVANLLALPAVAPAMWLGMLAAAGGQVPGFPVELLNAVNAPLLAYVAQVASWCGRPRWASVDVSVGGVGLVLSYFGIAAVALLAVRLRRRLRVAALRRRAPGRAFGARRRRWPEAAPAAVLGLVAIAFVSIFVSNERAAGVGPPSAGLRISVLDVGQGDAILLQPASAPPLLVDTGPSGEGLIDELSSAGVDRLGAVVLSHDQSDHAGGFGEVLGAIPVGYLLAGAVGRRTLGIARAAGVPARRLAQGRVLRSGGLSLEVLWPPAELLDSPSPVEDPNRLSIVLLARWRDFSILLTGDAEAEAIPLDPGPVDVLKVAHHGSEDDGLAALLKRTRPRLALISVGEDNPFGHPVPSTVATLAAHGVSTLRTDRDGTIVFDVGSGEGRGVPRTGGYSERAKRASPGEGHPFLP